MPELSEVEVVRRGLERYCVGGEIRSVAVHHPRSVRRHPEGADDLSARLTGRRIADVCRRGKYLWLTFAGSEADPARDALVVHLGMSGQMLIAEPETPLPAHAHIVAEVTDAPSTHRSIQLRFVDQRTFGGWFLAPLVRADGDLVPEPVAHIARDLFDPKVDVRAVARTLRAKRTEIKRGLLDQTVISGIGNIYADEALWDAAVHPLRTASTLTRSAALTLLDSARSVMTRALDVGGTSFDSLYVNVNGSSGYFSRSLNAYGREGKACPRCNTPIARAKFMNRSSFYCPHCQRPPRGKPDAIQKPSIPAIPRRG